MKNERTKELIVETIKATIDKESILEITGGESFDEVDIYKYYNQEIEDEVEIWSEKMFGRCCTEADLTYSEVLSFSINCQLENNEYPIRNLSDRKYLTSYVFKEGSNPSINLKLDMDNNYFSENFYPKLSPRKVLKETDTLLFPFRLSLVNGYTKSKDIFLKNGRVKSLKVFLNSNHIANVLLLDTPLVQEFKLDAVFTKNDEITLSPISYYEGTKYNDVCISEIQTSFSKIAHPNINIKYNVYKLNNN
ncbi:NADase-type glycan-binding domain-containing protein [Aquimarina sp. LLG6339-5]|uniref:NADase-type glycan-binding domain-containing protein n=1 Tax=Aquimarina sp. LLG6339-5 TaxID=3160830 RepID=UPI003863E541